MRKGLLFLALFIPSIIWCAATHTYVVSSVTAVGDVCTVVGTVDTIPTTGAKAVTVVVSTSDLLQVQAKGGTAALENYISPIMLSAAIANGLPAPSPTAVTQFPTGMFSLGGHTYVVSTATGIGNVLTVTATVDGTAVTITDIVSRAVQLNNDGGAVELEAYYAPILLAQAYVNGLTKPTVSQFPTGTFTL